jgi:hypothetical protein
MREAAISKKRLLVILGAGSSIPLGIPSVGDLDRVMRVWNAEWARSCSRPNYFEAAWNAVERYYNATGTGVHPVANFETVLGEALALAHWLAPAAYGNALRGLVASDGVRASLTSKVVTCSVTAIVAPYDVSGFDVR